MYFSKLHLAQTHNPMGFIVAHHKTPANSTIPAVSFRLYTDLDKYLKTPQHERLYDHEVIHTDASQKMKFDIDIKIPPMDAPLQQIQQTH